MTGEFVETVVFSLNPDVSREAFLNASEPSRSWYRAQPGYLSSELIEGADGRWVGLLRWTDATAAEDAQMRIANEIDMSAFFGFIDPANTVFVTGVVADRDG